jgi:dATP/dGTP diphosphohydrolase
MMGRMPASPEIGKKNNEGKAEFHLFPWGALREVGRVFTKGAAKYAEWNWVHVPNAKVRYFNAALRHLTAWWEGEQKDPEFGTNHLANACCCVLFLLALDLGGEFNDHSDKPGG